MVFRRHFAINRLTKHKIFFAKKFVKEEVLRGFLYVLIVKGKVEFVIPD